MAHQNQTRSLTAISLLCFGLSLFGGASCTKNEEAKKKRPTRSVVHVPLKDRIPDHFPASLVKGEYVGSQSCISCHTDQADKWSQSAHGRAMTRPGPTSVLGQFNGKPVNIETGTITPTSDNGQFLMTLKTSTATESHIVQLVMAYGRQHQVYFTQLVDGSYKMLPIEWSTSTNAWIETKYYQPNELDPASQKHWHRADAQLIGCMSCHLSQGHIAREGAGIELKWTELPVNCESCHGPGKVHVSIQQNGDEATEVDNYGRLKSMSQQDDARICGRCHDSQGLYSFPESGSNSLKNVNAWTLGRRGLRVDGTQYGVAYQMAGHLLSECFNGGSMACVHCHDPHTDKARDLIKNSAVGQHTNRQCDVCHRNYIGEKAAQAHSHHSSSITCVDCHMGYSWIFDDPNTTHKTSDHSIQTPRPAESIAVGTPNACVTCHSKKTNQWALDALKRWGSKQGTMVRPWVYAIDSAIKAEPEAGEKLDAILKDKNSPWLLQLSALELLGRQPSLTPGIIETLESFTRSEDPQIRTYALATLMDHDSRGNWRWIFQGITDPHFLVNTAAIDGAIMSKSASRIPQRLVEKFVDNELNYSIDPFYALWRIGQLYEARGQFAYALEAASFAAQWMKPSQAYLGFDRWHQTLQQKTR